MTRLYFVIIIVLIIGGFSWLADSFYGTRKANGEIQISDNRLFAKQQFGESTRNKSELMKKHSEWLKETSEAMIKDINFYGKVVDQHGHPVEGVSVEYIGIGAPYASGTGVAITKTDSDGIFSTADAAGASLEIRRLSKTGYDFRFSSARARHFSNDKTADSEKWNNYSKENPFVYTIWKIESYPNVKMGGGRWYGYGFDSDGSIYTLDFLADGRQLNRGEAKGDVRVSFVRSGETWVVRFEGVEGGLLESEEIYLGRAPSEGYSPVIEFKGSDSRVTELAKNIYFNTRGGKVYGSAKLHIKPYHSPKQSLIYIEYVVNMDGGRNLYVPKKEEMVYFD